MKLLWISTNSNRNCFNDKMTQNNEQTNKQAVSSNDSKNRKIYRFVIIEWKIKLETINSNYSFLEQY